MPLEDSLKRRLLVPGVYNLPRLLSLAVLIMAFFSLLMNWALLKSRSGPVPSLYQAPAATALSMLLLAFSFRLMQWESQDQRSARRAKFSRMMAGLAALLTLLEAVLRRQGAAKDVTPIVVALEISLLSTAVMLLASRGSLHVRRVLLSAAAVVSLWLCLANLYGVDPKIGHEFTSDPASALMTLLMTSALALVELRNGLIPPAVRSIIGKQAGQRLLFCALLVPMLAGYLRMELERNFLLPMPLLLTLHVLLTLAVMAGLLYWSLREAHGRIAEQMRLQYEHERSERTLEALLEGGSEVFLRLSLRGELLAANENAIRCLGLHDPEERKQNINDWIVPESQERLRELPKELLSAITTNTVLVFRNSSQELLPLFVTAACRMQHGAPDEILLVGRALPLGLRSPGHSDSLMVAS